MMLKKSALLAACMFVIGAAQANAAVINYSGSVFVNEFDVSGDFPESLVPSTLEFSFEGTFELTDLGNGDFLAPTSRPSDLGPLTLSYSNEQVTYTASNTSARLLVGQEASGYFASFLLVGGDEPFISFGTNNFGISAFERSSGDFFDAITGTGLTIDVTGAGVTDQSVGIGSASVFAGAPSPGSVTFTEVAPVPVPPAALLFGTALLGAGYWRRRKQRSAAA